MANKAETTLISQRHPLWSMYSDSWLKWRLCYEGGHKFRDNFLYRYSKREDDDDYKLRKKLTYIPGHARSVINIIRNGLAVRLPEVVREGSPAYLEAMMYDVDTFRNSMNSYVALEIVAMLLTQGKRLVVVDAPPGPTEGATRAEDNGSPFFYSVNADQVLSWSYDEKGQIDAVLMELVKDMVDPNTKLVIGSSVIYRYMRLLGDGEEVKVGGELHNGPGVLVADYDKAGKLCGENATRLLRLSRVPVVEFSLVDSVMGEIADHQISLLNLASTDMDFLWRGNFPIYVEQVMKSANTIRPRGTKSKTTGQDDQDTDSQKDPGTESGHKQRKTGTAKGIAYKEGLETPSFINPATDNLEASMNKQDSLAKEIRVLVDLALVSLSVKAVEQSGKSKLADRIGEEAGLAYIGSALQTGERELAAIWHEMNGDNPDLANVIYPNTYSLKTTEERREEAEALRKLRNAVRSPQYTKEIDKRTVDVLLKALVDQETLDAIYNQIDQADWFDDDASRAEVVQKDVVTGLITKETAANLRGYDRKEPALARMERAQDVDALLGEAGAGATTRDKIPSPGQNPEDITDEIPEDEDVPEDKPAA